MSSNNNDIRDGMVSQIFANDVNSTNDYTNLMLTFAIGTKTFDFINDTLNLSRDFDCYIPQCFVINLYPWQNLGLSATEYVNNVCRYFYRMRLVLQVSEQTILHFPLSLLHELKPAELYDGKIYIRIPFEAYLDQINMNELFYSTVSFDLLNASEISNYSNSFSMIAKVYIHDQIDQSRINSRHTGRRLMQQMNTMYISAPNNSLNATNRRIFQIQTNSLVGSTKGLLIQCKMNDLQSIKFYVNNNLRFDYGRYLVLNACVKLSENLLYMPFTDHADFLDRDANTYLGSINLTRLQSSTLCLCFSEDQSRIIIHNVYFNFFRQTNGLGGLCINNRPAFVEQTTNEHPIQPIQSNPFSASMIDMSGNQISSASSNAASSRRNIFDMSGNNVSSNLAASTSSASTSSASTASTSSTASYSITVPGLTNNYINNIIIPDIEYPIPNGIITNQLINADREVCYITHDTIGINQNYMSCSNCQHNFMETAIKQWLRQRVGNLRNCPTCREVWTNYTVYINREESI